MPTQPRLLLIGGSGHVSGNLAREAVAQGFDVTVITRGQKPLPDGVTALVADRKDTAAMRHALDGRPDFDLAVDCIGYEVEDTKQDLELLRDRARQFVFISTDFVFDSSRRMFPQPFDNPFFLTGDSYGAKKRRCEELLLADDSGWHWTVFRPCHIYGPPSYLGCLPNAARDPELLAKLRAGRPVPLVGGGHFLQQPLHVRDLARLILSVRHNPLTHRKVYCAAGPDLITSYRYYEIIGEVLGVPVTFEELPVAQSLADHPEWASFLCHRLYDLTPLRLDGLQVPNIPITKGLREHTECLLWSQRS